jgi:hypothetical protein
MEASSIRLRAWSVLPGRADNEVVDAVDDDDDREAQALRGLASDMRKAIVKLPATSLYRPLVGSWLVLLEQVLRHRPLH